MVPEKGRKTVVVVVGGGIPMIKLCNKVPEMFLDAV